MKRKNANPNNESQSPRAPKARQRKISVPEFRALLHAVIDNPACIKDVARLRPGLEKRVFDDMLECRPTVGMDQLYQVAIHLGQREILHRLVNHAILTRKADDLWCVVLRLARKWVSLDFRPAWDHEEAAAEEVMRLMLHVSLPYHEEMKKRLNPKKQLWFLPGVDFSKLWKHTIRLEIEAGRWDDAFDSLVTAACGLPVSDERMARWAKDPRFHAVAEAKDYLQDDGFGWKVYGRTADLPGLVNYLWTLYVDAGMVSRLASGRAVSLAAGSTMPHAQTMDFRMRDSMGKVMAEYRSLIGILARDAKRVEHEIVKYRGEKRCRPVFVAGRTKLSRCMAKFQQLVFCYRRRQSAGLRPIVNVRPPKQDDQLLS